MSSLEATPLAPADLRALIAALGRGLLERDDAVRLALLAALAGEHVLLLGPPGTAKSALARRLHRAFAGSRYFERLLTRFSTPEELFGPLSLRALEHDRYERLIDGFLPTAGIAFLDEVFKANSAILNALLTLLNERQFDNGTERITTPLVCVVAASNELPTDEALQAFHDRFLLRIPVMPVADASFCQLLALPDDGEGELPVLIRTAQRERLVREAQQVALGDSFVSACVALRAWLQQRQAPMSDRRWRQFVSLARVAAASEGRASVDELDLGLAPFVAAARPEDVQDLQAWFVDEVVQAPPAAAPWLMNAVTAFEQQLGLEQQAPAVEGDDGAGKMALARAIGLADPAMADTGSAAASPQRFVSERLEAQLRRRWSQTHIDARVAQVAEVLGDVQAHLAQASDMREQWQQRLQQRVWLPSSLSTRLLARHDAAVELLREVGGRLNAVRDGFATLQPQDEHHQDSDGPALS